MAKINLLPWRAERRKQREREFYGMLGIAALVAGAIGVGAVMHHDAMIENQKRRNGLLTTEISALDARITEIADLERKKSAMLNRKAVIEQLQASRSQMVHLFDELVRTIPEGVRLNSIKQSGDQLTLDGLAQSNARVSAYLRNLGGSEWLTNPDLTIIDARTGGRPLPGDETGMRKFSLRVTLKKAPGEEEQAAGAAAAGGGTS